ncbi:hypothetical protein KBX50_08410 [Micromonospora sp. C51]|uniref:hypothetical protein n=1 Tax=Micromonospora sp. C51 TaxID=2824879 RepID=UPI001B392FCB|nr:hypothetical protein [Micromonospora sp. C51]MBQ1048485.1 hypothetical protein [Micromonospora sp. C51]
MEPNQAAYYRPSGKTSPADIGRAAGVVAISPILFLFSYAAARAIGGDGATILAPAGTLVLLVFIVPALKRR